jgi:ABC-type Fe3+-hydroxamate transport system substrate-binding protein
VIYRDALDRDIDIPAPPQRIVSLVPSLTEALFAFGAGDRVVGRTRYCVEPHDAVHSVPKVGGTKNVDADAVARLQPDLGIANVEENTREDIERLVDAGLTIFVTYPRSVSAAVEELRLIAEITDTRNEAAPILVEAADEIEFAEADERPRMRVFCPIWREPWMTIGPDTYMHDLLTLCGGQNIYDDSPDRYPEVTLAGVAARDPEIILLPDEPFHFREKHIPEVIAEVGDKRIYLVDGKLLCWYGPRIPEAIRHIRRLLRGEVGM